MNQCDECAMVLKDPSEYHPYAACLMFKAGVDGDTVRANLDAVRANGAQWEHEAMQARLAEADVLIRHMRDCLDPRRTPGSLYGRADDYLKRPAFSAEHRESASND